MSTETLNRSRLVAAAVVGIVGALPYVASIGFGFVPSWDDGSHVVDNAAIRSLDLELVRWAFARPHALLYVPLTWLSFGLDHAVSGGAPWSFHLTNVLLHALNGALLFLLVARLLAPPRTRSGALQEAGERALMAAAAFGALAFAVHPLRVESVAWVAERKDVLAGALALGATHCWLSQREREEAFLSSRWWWGSLALATLAALAKPVAVALPVCWGGVEWALAGHWRDAARRLGRLGPHLAAALALAVVTARAHRAIVEQAHATYAPLATRLLVALRAPIACLEMTLAPVGLRHLHLYPPGDEVWGPRFLVEAAVALAVTIAALALRRRLPHLLAAWLAWLALVAPSSGLVQAGPQLVADRFSYFPAAVASVAAGWVALRALRTPPAWARASALAAVVLIAVLGVLAARRTEHWRDGVTFWSHAIAEDPGAGLAWHRRAEEQLRLGKLDAAIGDLDESVAVARRKPQAPLAKVLRMRAAVLGDLGRAAEASRDLEEAAALESARRR